MAPILPFAKLLGVVAKQVAGPLSRRLQATAKSSPLVRRQCIMVGQSLHWLSTRILRKDKGMDLQHEVMHTVPYYDADSKPSEPLPAHDGEGEVAGSSSSASFAETLASPVRTGAAGEMEPAGKLQRARFVDLVDRETRGPPREAMHLVQWKARSSGQKRRGWIPKHTDSGRETLRIMVVKPLNEEEALEKGCKVLGEGIVLSVAMALIVEEGIRKMWSDEATDQKRRVKSALRDQEALERDERLARHKEQLDVAREQLDALSLDSKQARKEARQATLVATTAAAVGFCTLLLSGARLAPRAGG